MHRRGTGVWKAPLPTDEPAPVAAGAPR
jgi:hypothetical protein